MYVQNPHYCFITLQIRPVGTRQRDNMNDNESAAVILNDTDSLTMTSRSNFDRRRPNQWSGNKITLLVMATLVGLLFFLTYKSFTQDSSLNEMKLRYRRAC